MTYWRVTKYNPIYRNEKGWYMRDEWTSISDVGTYYDGVEFTMGEYLKVEEAYVNSVVLIMQELGVNSLRIAYAGKWNYRGKRHALEKLGAEKLYKSIKSGIQISIVDIPLLTKLVLREIVWVKLEHEKMFVHFGDDYYMYFGFVGSLVRADKQITNSGLFIDKNFISPYLDVEE